MKIAAPILALTGMSTINQPVARQLGSSTHSLTNVQICSGSDFPRVRASNTPTGDFIISLSRGAALSETESERRSNFSKQIHADIEQPYYRLVFQSGRQKSGVSPTVFECMQLGESQFYVIDDGKGTAHQTLFDCAQDYDVRACHTQVAEGDVKTQPEGMDAKHGEIEFVLGGEVDESVYCAAKDTDNNPTQSTYCEVTARTNALLKSTVCNEEGKCLTLNDELDKELGHYFGNNRYAYDAGLNTVKQIYLNDFVETYCAEGKLDESFLDLRDECDAAKEQQKKRETAMMIGLIGSAAVMVVGCCGPLLVQLCNEMREGIGNLDKSTTPESETDEEAQTDNGGQL